MSRNRIKSTLLALLLSLAMVVTYLPASMIAYAGNEDIDDTAIELNTDADDDVIVDDVQNVDGVSDEESAPVAAPETGDEEGDVDVEEEDLTSSEEPAEADSEPAEEASPMLGATRDAKADGLTVLAFTSDTHNASGNSAANRLGTWLDNMATMYGSVDVMAFGGDMASASTYNDSFWTLTQADIDMVAQKGVPAIYTTGNHEYMNGSYSNGSNTTTKNFIEDTEVCNEPHYRMYCLGTSSYARGGSWNSYDSTQIDKLETYLNGVGTDKPIFIITHYPLHWTSSRSISGAGSLIDLLNEQAAKGKKIVFLWGHNHTDANKTNVETHYDEIFAPNEELQYASGQKKTLQFYYAAAGCMSDSDYGAGSGAVKGKGLIVTINSKNQLSFAYHDASGNNVTEDGTGGAGTAYTEQDPVAVTGVTINQESATVEVGRSVKLSVTIEPSDATNKSVTWSSADTSIATVDKSGKVKGVGEGHTTITATSNDTTNRAVPSDSIEVTVTPRTSTETNYVIKIGNYVLSTERSSDKYTQSSSSTWGSSYTYTGLAAVADSSAAGTDDETRWVIEESDDGNGYSIMSLDGRYLNATYTSSGSSWNSSSQGDLKLDDTPDVWVLDSGVTLDSWEVDGSYLKSTNASSGSSSDKYLAEETGDSGNHLFTVRSRDNADETIIDQAGDPVAVTGVSVSPATATVEARKTVQLTATVAPENATNKKVTWSSSDTTKATIDENGKVKGVSPGTATITATSADNAGIKATCVVTVTEAQSVSGNTFVLTDEIVEGGEYLIVSSKADGNAYALKNPRATSSGASAAATQVEIADETIETEADDIVWTAESRLSGFTLMNGEDAILGGKSGNLGIYTLANDPYDDRYWTYSNNYLQYMGGSYTYELYYENGFTVRSFNSGNPSHPVYIYERTDTTPVAVSGVTLDKNSLSLKTGRTATLTATVTPKNAANKNVTWSSGNTSVATVDTNGKVTAVAAGTATITVASAENPSITATCEVTVTEASAEKHYVIVTEDHALTYDRSPNTANGGSSSYTYTGLTGVAYASGDVASDNMRFIFEETDGGYYIKDLDGNYLNATYTSGSNSGKGDLKLDSTKDVWVLDSGYSLVSGTVNGSKLKSTNASASATSDKFLSYEDSATLFSVRSSGNADEITIEEASDPIGVTGVTVSPSTATVEAKKTVQLTATVTPSNATNKKVIWSTSNTSIATVDENGKVKGVAEGTATITATTADGEKTATCTVTVEPAGPVTGTAYTLTETLTSGQDYLIANGKTGSVYIVSTEANGSRTLKGVSVEVEDNTITIPEDVEAKTAFTCDLESSSNAKSTRLKNGSQYLYADSSDGLRMITLTSSQSGKYWHYKADGKDLLWFFKGDDGYSDTSSTYKYYLKWDSEGNFTDDHVSTTSLANTSNLPKVYLFVKDESTPHTHSYGAPVWTWTGNDTSGYTAATAAFTCSGCGDVQTVNATVTSSTSGNTTVYTTTATFNGQTYSDTKTVEAAHEHSYGAPTWTWTGSDADGYTAATAKFTCSDCGDEQTVNATVTSNTSGTTTVYTATATFNGQTYTDTKTVEAAHEHSYETPTYVWTSDNSTCTATATCSGCAEGTSGHTVTETVNTTNATTATCEEDGSTTYTAVFTKAPFTAQTKSVDTPALGHDWGEPSYTWTSDNSNCAAVRVCSRCKNPETENVNSTVIDTTATCTEAGEATYEATFTNPAFETQRTTGPAAALNHDLIHHDAQAATCTEEGWDAYDTCSRCDYTTIVKIPALGHDWNEPIWAWTGDDEDGYTAAVATFTCKIDTSHKRHVDASDIAVVRVDPQPGAAGSITYTATITGPDSKSYSDSKIVTIPPTGYTFKEPEYTWNETAGGWSVTALKECNEDPAQNISETVEAAFIVKTPASCLSEGAGTYTASFTNTVFETQTKDAKIAALGHDLVHHDAQAATCDEAGRKAYDTCSRCDYTSYEEIAALGHKWKFAGFAWIEAEGGYAAVANYTCENDENHINTASAEVTAEVTAATCDNDGSTVYAAAITAEDSLDKAAHGEEKTVVIPKLGHKWGAPVWTWTGNDADGYTAAKATFTCENDAEHVREASDNELETVTVDPTPAEAGSITYKSSVTGPDGKTYTDEKVKTIPAEGYTYKVSKYTWADDNKSVTALKECNEDPAHNITETVNTTSTVKTPATCTEKGTTTYTATFTGEAFETQTKDVKDIETIDHSWDEGKITTEATCAKDGVKTFTCSVCGETKTEAIAATGEHEYGEYALTTAATASTSGILTRTCKNCSKKETKVVSPVLAKAVVASSTSAKISWSKSPYAGRYVVYFSLCNEDLKAVKTTKTNSELSYKKTGLKNGKYYKFKVVAQRNIDGKWTNISTSYAGHFVAGNLDAKKRYTNVKSITVPKTSVSLAKGKTYTIKPKMTMVKSGKKVLSTGHAATYRYMTTNKAIATVSSKGKITAKGSGTCKIYVVGVNGVYRAITVTVK